MSIASRIFAWVLKLPPVETHDVVVERDIKVPMDDGVVLLADHYYPRGGGKPPTILIRSPYGRGGLFGLQYGRLFAERGFQVLVQSCRGTADSGGQFEPFRHERADGLATVEWIKGQDWFSGELATTGASYLAYAQWAIARDAGPELKVMAVQVGQSDIATHYYPGGSFTLDDALNWSHGFMAQEGQSELARMAGMMGLGPSARKVKSAADHLPLSDVDHLLVGKKVKFWQDFLEHDDPNDEWWKPADHSDTVGNVIAPVHLAGGWYDLFLPWQLRDYRELQEAGRKPHLLIGPWTHVAAGSAGPVVRESLAWLRAHLFGERSGLRQEPVRLFVMGADEWRDFAEWPPPGSHPERWYLQQGGGLAPELPTESEPDRYRYDPADPTPTVGGVMFGPNSGPKDNRALEARPDVLVYTSKPLDHDLEVIGPVTADLFVRSSLEHTDFFARLCDVYPSGKSINICDGLLRLHPGRLAPEADGHIRVGIDLWPTAYCFRRGHRLRLQVSSGDHPHLARNPGSGEPLATATTLRAADQTVYHDPAHPSAIVLPVLK